MNSLKKFIADYFTFSKSQRNGILIALSIITISLFIRFFYSRFISFKIIPADTTFFKQAAQLKSVDTNTSMYHNRSHFQYNEEYADANYNEPNDFSQRENINGKLFEFDPNTLSADDWKRLGVKDKTIQIIQNYLAKGGRFHSPEDIKRIYGLSPEQAERLLPFVHISDNLNGAAFNKSLSNTNTHIIKNVDINNSDTSAYISLPGIGAKLAGRIIAFRNKLGGFYSIDQVKETFGLPDSTFQKIKGNLNLGTISLKKININTATAEVLKQHPYIRGNIVNAILQYRSQHGNFSSVNDLKKIDIIDDQLFNKVSPYLSIQ